MFNSKFCDRIIDIGLPAKRPQTVPACYDSMKNCSLHWSALPWIRGSLIKIARPADGFLDLGHLGLVLEPLIQGRSA